MTDTQENDREQADMYDEAAGKIDWRGPSLVFGLLSPSVRPGQTVLDIGIGTGLGSEPLFRAGMRVTGMDLSGDMIRVCQNKGIAENLVCHDLTVTPYPFGDASFDCVISTGVFQFFSDLDLVFGEVARLLADKGLFAFVVGDRTEEEPAECIAGPEQTGTGESVTMYRVTPPQVAGWLEKNGLCIVDSIGFTIWMDELRTKELPARACLAEKAGRP